MSDVKISNLPASTTPLAGSEVLPVVQGGVTKKVSVDNLTAGKAISTAGVTDTSLTASKPVFTDANKKLTSSGTLATDQGGTGTSTSFTAGSVVFAGASGVYSQNNSNFFWDNTNARLGIGSASPSVKLYVRANLTAGTSNSIRFLDDGAAATSTNNNSYGYGFNASTGELSTTAGNGGFHTWYTANTEKVRIFNSGGVSIGNTTDPGASNLSVSGNVVIATSGKGIDFSATAGTGTSELLADYEEGTWTPTLTTSGTNFTSVTYENRVGTYTKIGNLVTVTGRFYTSAVTIGSASGNVQIGGLPFSTTSAVTVGLLSDTRSWTTNNPSEMLVASAGTVINLLYKATANGDSVNLAVANVGTGNPANIIHFSISYFA